MLTNVGRAILARLAVNDSGVVAYDITNCYLAVGNGATAAAPGNTTLLAEFNPGRAKVDAVTVSGNAITFTATFTAGNGTGDWIENGVFNNSARDTGTMLTRVIEPGTYGLGSKGTNAVWVLSKTLTITYA